LASAERYTQVAGWRIFIVRENKSTFPNCVTCAEAGYTHKFSECGHLLCHAQHAGTTDMDRIREMFERYPNGLLAVATGRVSRLIALDFEAHTDDPELPTGLDVLDGWESYTQGMTLPNTLVAQTGSGGRHLLYQIGDDDVVTSRNRILPSTDVKGDGGYVVLPPGPGRVWITRGLPAHAPAELLTWLAERRGRSSTAWNSKTTGQRVGHADGYDFELFFRAGCPGGYRDEFINDLIFRLRKRGKSYAEAINIVQYAHSMVAQPPYAKYYMPWDHVQYKLDRVWRTVQPDAVEIPRVAQHWIEKMTQATQTTETTTMATTETATASHTTAQAQDDGTLIHNEGRVTIVRRAR